MSLWQHAVTPLFKCLFRVRSPSPFGDSRLQLSFSHTSADIPFRTFCHAFTFCNHEGKSTLVDNMNTNANVDTSALGRDSSSDEHAIHQAVTDARYYLLRSGMRDEDAAPPLQEMKDCLSAYKIYGLLALAIPILNIYGFTHASGFLTDSFLDAANDHDFLHSAFWFATLQDGLMVAVLVAGYFAWRGATRESVALWWKAAMAICATSAVLAAAQILGGHLDVQEYLNERWSFAYERAPYLLHEEQHKHKCCGFSSFNDRGVPKNPKTKTSCIDSPEYGFHEACFPIVKNEYAAFMTTFGTAMLTVATIQMLCLIHAYHTTPNLLSPHDQQHLPEHDQLPIGGGDESNRFPPYCLALPPGYTICGTPHFNEPAPLQQGVQQGQVEQRSEEVHTAGHHQQHNPQQMDDQSLIDLL
ncbi:hypothetical protein DFJ77DRAFT_543429 [Powellomyces hirtus]|nr:hypothetical protein DFJ77DRAFT_543429 [Powellomyces hirtus]